MRNAKIFTDEISTKEAKILFKIRTEIFEVKHNFKNRYIKKFNESQVNQEALLCPLCHYHVGNFENMFKCSAFSINNKNDQTTRSKTSLPFYNWTNSAPDNKQYSKLKWKKLVKEEVWKKCETDLREEIKKLEKLVESKMSDEMFETKSYLKNMTLENARVKFKIRTEMLNLKFNYKHMPQNEKTLWQCDSCQSSIETQSHIMWCPAYRELRVGKDINDDNDLIEYVKKVMKIRENLNVIK